MPFLVNHKEKSPVLRSALQMQKYFKFLAPTLVRLHRYPTSCLYLEDYTALLVKVGKTMGNGILMIAYQKQSANKQLSSEARKSSLATKFLKEESFSYIAQYMTCIHLSLFNL